MASTTQITEPTGDIKDSVILSEKCDPCQIHGKQSEATAFCIDCDENLCESCTIIHTSKKITKHHKPIPINDKKKALKEYCEACQANPKEAVKFCEECEEYLCPMCVNVHLKRKATKDHIPIDVCLLQQRSGESDESALLCNICFLSDRNVKAEHFCDHCKELLCIDCTNVHKKSKATRSHMPLSVTDVPALNRKVANRLCEPCKLCNVSKTAVLYCEECEEFLCGGCGKMHGLQKSTMLHALINAMDIETNDRSCDVCVKINEVNPAHLMCEVCKEALCQKCVLIHTNQKATKDHELKGIDDKIFEGTDMLKKVCDLCDKRNLENEAEKYCKQCGLFLCKTCKGKHELQKSSNDHEIVDAEAFTYVSRMCAFCYRNQAANYCMDCSEALCEDCTDFHTLNKQTRKHEIIDINEAPEQSIEECEQCKVNEKISQAIKYCTECKEYLCDGCCIFHMRYKLTKNHELKDIEEFKKENKCDCDPCMFSDNKEVDAEVFCVTCEEFLCGSCLSRHKAAKISRNHTIISIEEGRAHSLENVLLCDPCKYNKKSKKAFAYCYECSELVCDICYKHHTSQKQTREHKLLTDLSKYSTELEEEPVMRENSYEKFGKPERENENKAEPLQDVPGKPTFSSAKADSIVIVWQKPERFEYNRDYYQVSYKEVGREKWKFFPGEHEVANVQVTDLKASTQYLFRVRVVHPKGEGQYSEESDIIETIVSPAARLVDFSTIVKKGKPSPSVYGVPITEVPLARNIPSKTKKFEVGGRRMDVNKEKTIMLVGATGTGKSTLVDGIVNVVLGVNWSDKFRFTIIDLEDEEKAKSSNQAESQTEWITVYTIHPEPGGRLDYRLNIIDTPGFGDTRGLHRDQQIVEQIRALFSESGEKGVQCIDAICFLIKAPDARLTAVQSYIFQQIMALFGKDVEHNICSLITFADGISPPVLAALNHSGLPFGKHFTFNNSGLFATNCDNETAGLSPMFWEMGLKSFNAFFAHLDTMETKSLTLTKNVLDERKRLETTVQNLQPQVDAGLAKLNMLNDEIRIITQHKLDADANKDFEYEVEEIEQHKHDLPKGKHTTNCLHCNFTCHKNCAFSNDEQKKDCSVMDREGNCTQCSEKCNWQTHSNTPYIFEYVTVKKKKTYEEKLQKYQDAEGRRLTHEQVVQKMKNELQELEEGIEFLMTTVKDCNEKLSAIALRPNPLSMVAHIELMVKAEQMEQKQGFMQRISMLEEMKKRALITTKAADLQKQFKIHNKSLNQKGDGKPKKEEKSKLKRFLGYITG